MSLLIQPVSTPNADMRGLLQELNDALAANYAPDQRHGLSLEQLFQPAVRFFIAYSDQAPVGCGGVAVCEGYAEVKRMYARPAARGHGIAKALLTHLAAQARAAHQTILRLETGIHQTDAIALYERFGFVRCVSFGPYAAMPPNATTLSVFFELTLSVP